MVTAATIYMALLGYRGLQRVALACVGQTAKLAELLTAIDGVEQIFSAPNFHEVVLRLNRPVEPVLETLAANNILGGFDLSRNYPELGDALLVCATETKTDADLEAYATALASALHGSQAKSA
jgi:glycine dehydrogenase subunit 1